MTGRIEKALDAVLPAADVRPVVLSQAMRWAVMGGGKRIRPQVCLMAAVAAGGGEEEAIWPACAIELLHSYTLVHDDLPSMDNDTMRRGRASVWAKFGEANAILAGDALLALAHRVAAKAPRNVAAIVDVLGEKGVGVVQGQVEDVAGNVERGVDVSFVYSHKTADLFIAAAAMGGLAGGGSEADVAALKEFALNLGLAFQYEDDLLDGDGFYSREETGRRVRETTDAAIAALGRLPGDVTFLRDLSSRLVSRTH